MYEQAFKDLGITDEAQQQRYTTLLIAIDAPYSLLGIVGVLNNILGAFESSWFENVLRDDKLSFFIRQTLDSALELLTHIKTQQIKSDYERNPDDRELFNLFAGELGNHPFYPLHYLLNIHNSDFFIWMRQALLIVPFMVRNQVLDERRLMKYEPRKLSVFFRRMTTEEVTKSWLKETNCSQCLDLRVFISFLYQYRYYLKQTYKLSATQLKSQGKADPEYPEQRAIFLYHEVSTCIKILEIALGYEKKRKGSSAPKNGAGQIVRSGLASHGVTALEGDVLIQLETLPDESDDDNVLYSVLQTQLDESYQDAGEEIYEQQQSELYIFSDSEPVEAYVAAFHGRRLAKAVTKRIERQHQYLRTDRHTLTNSQVHQLLTWCASNSRYDEDSDAAFVASLAFFTARLPIYLGRTIDQLDDKSTDYPQLSLNTKQLALPVFNLPYRTDERNIEDLTRAHTLLLPLPKVLGFTLDKFRHAYIWLDRELLASNSYCGTGLSLQNHLRSRVSPDISIQQVSNHLFLRACTLFGTACATLMFSRPAPGTQARLYYTALPVSLLQQRYKQLLNVVASEAGLKIEFYDDEQPSLNYKEIYVGCRYLPTISQYQHLIQSLLGKLSDLAKQLPGEFIADNNTAEQRWVMNQWLQFHNTYTAYCIVCQGLLTGLRPTHTGFIRFSDMLLDAKAAVIRDKDSADEFHTRTIPLHPLAIKIAKLYRSHINVVLGRLQRLGLLKVWQQHEKPEPFFFTNTGKTKNSVGVTITPYRPLLLMQELKPYFVFPPNSNRKFLRSYLELNNVPAVFIDSMLGHGNLGEHHWHSHSTASLYEVRASVEPCLDDVIKQLGMIALKGLNT